MRRLDEIATAVMALLGCLFLGSSLVYGQDKETLSVAYAHWPPWKVIGENSFDGIDARIIKSLADKAGFSVEFSECPWVRCVDMFKTGEVDLITSFGRTEAREKFSYYLGPPYKTMRIYFWIKWPSSITIETLEDLDGLRIGQIKGSSYFALYDNWESLNKISVTNERQLFEMLANNRLDTFIGYEQVVNYGIATTGFKEKFIQSGFHHVTAGSYIAMSKKSRKKHWKQTLAETMKEMIGKGEIEEAIHEFMDEVGED